MQVSHNERRYAIGSAGFAADALSPGLYVTATPIGNLSDITIRALQTLAAADAILCEDTRMTSRLADRYAIQSPLIAYHEHNAAKVRPSILRRLTDGAALALVSDAGMPLVSDPGYRLVSEAVAQGITVTVVPGASAVLAGLALSALPTDKFCFLGFLPARAGERRRLLEDFGRLPATLVFFESPGRVLASLAAIAELYPSRQVAVARELTKLHEEVLRGTAGEVAAGLGARPAIKGEITLLMAPCHERAAPGEASIDAAIADALQAHSASAAAAEVARRLGIPRREVYARILARRAGEGGE